SSPQEAVARRFSDKHEDRFEGIGYRLSPEGLVLLDGALAHVVCERYTEYPGGDHTIVLGQVIGGTTSTGHPLLFYRGGYAALE
ncbi:MAG TPA: flavin reductase family protein, partial [Gemmatimonadales bacterium]|nr:flavin reductase family protein [Gemmatimonadales bacterium]